MFDILFTTAACEHATSFKFEYVRELCKFTSLSKLGLSLLETEQEYDRMTIEQDTRNRNLHLLLSEQLYYHYIKTVLPIRLITEGK